MSTNSKVYGPPVPESLRSKSSQLTQVPYTTISFTRQSSALSDYYSGTEEESELAMVQMLKDMERNRAILQANALKDEIEAIQNRYKGELQTVVKETQAAITSFKDQINQDMSGQLSKKVKSTAEEKIKAYDDLIG